MDVEFAFLCDYAHAGDKLAAHGIGIDSIYANNVPVTHAQLFAVLVIKFTSAEMRHKKDIKMHLQDADARDIIPPLSIEVNKQSQVEGQTHHTHRFVTGMYSIPFTEFGGYQLSWLVDDIEVHALQFQVAKRGK